MDPCGTPLVTHNKVVIKSDRLKKKAYESCVECEDSITTIKLIQLYAKNKENAIKSIVFI